MHCGNEKWLKHWKSLVVPIDVKQSLHDPAIPLLGVCPREKKKIIHDNFHTNVYSGTFTAVKWYKQPKCSLTYEWINGGKYNIYY